MLNRPMRLHWSPRSPFVRKVLIAAHEAGIARRIELLRTVVAPTAPNPALLRDNPLGKLPTLILPDGSTVFDSTVIIEYFAGLAPAGALLPVEPEARLAALRDKSLGDGLLDLLLLWLDERHRRPEAQSPELLAANEVKFDYVINFLDASVTALEARRFDIGHITIGCALSYVGFRFSDLQWQEMHPRLADWLAAFQRRPSVLAVPVIDDLDAPIAPPVYAESEHVGGSQ